MKAAATFAKGLGSESSNPLKEGQFNRKKPLKEGQLKSKEPLKEGQFKSTDPFR